MGAFVSIVIRLWSVIFSDTIFVCFWHQDNKLAFSSLKELVDSQFLVYSFIFALVYSFQPYHVDLKFILGRFLITKQ